MANEKLKLKAERCGVKLWEIAARFGVSDSQFSRWLRTELDPEKQGKAFQYLEEIAHERLETEEQS